VNECGVNGIEARLEVVWTGRAVQTEGMLELRKGLRPKEGAYGHWAAATT